jgi:hypothetical protein
MKVQTAILSSSVAISFCVAGCACGRGPDQVQNVPKQPAQQSGVASQRFVESPALVVPHFPKAPAAAPEHYQTEGPATPRVDTPPEEPLAAEDNRILPPKSYRLPNPPDDSSPVITARPRRRRPGTYGAGGWTGSASTRNSMGPKTKAAQSAAASVMGVT